MIITSLTLTQTQKHTQYVFQNIIENKKINKQYAYASQSVLIFLGLILVVTYTLDLFSED